MNSALKNFLKNGSLLVVSLIIALIIGELFLRVALPKNEQVKDDQIIKTDPLLGNVLIPSSFQGIDARGFRGYEDFQNKNQLTSYPIIALGDSHTYGLFNQPQAAWPADLAKILHIPVYNMGIWGYGVAQYYALLTQALALHPKIIVVGLYLGNDLFDSYQVVYNQQGWDQFKKAEFTTQTKLPSNYITNQHVFLKGFRDWLRSDSVLYKFLSDRTRIIREKLGLAKAKNIGTEDWSNNDENVSLLFKDPKITTRFWSGSRIKGLDLTKPAITEGLALSEQFLDLMNAQAKATGAKLVIAYIPTKESVYQDQTAGKAQENIFYKNILINEEKIKQQLNDFCLVKEISCFDLLPYLRNELNQGVKIYQESIDDHPAPLGYQKYAEGIAAFLKGFIGDLQKQYESLNF